MIAGFISAWPTMRKRRSNRQHEKSRDSLKIGEYAVRTMALSISLQMLLSALLTTVSVTGSFSGASRPVPTAASATPGRLTMRLPSAPISTSLPGGTRVVESISSMIAGPAMTLPAGSSARR